MNGRRFTPYSACAAVVALYQALYVNGFFPITEGWFSEYAHLIRGGLIPYRDFSLLLPPLYPLQIAAVQSIAGENFYPLHIFGIFVTCGIALALLDILANVFDRWISAFVATAAAIYYQSGNAFVNYDFTQFVTLYLFIAAALSLRSVRTPEFSAGARRCFAAGIFCGLAILIKQSNGGIASVVLLGSVLIASLALFGVKQGISRFAIAVAGLLFPIALIVLWLGSQHAFQPFIRQTIEDAARAKGGLNVFGWFALLFRSAGFWPAQHQLALHVMEILGAMAVLAALSALLFRAARMSTQTREKVRRRGGAALGVLGLLALCALIAGVVHGGCGLCKSAQGFGSAVLDMQAPYIWTIDFYLVGTCVALGLLAVRRNAATAAVFIIAAFGVGLIFGNGASAGLSEISTFLAVAMFFSYVLSVGAGYILPSLVPLGVLAAFCSVFIAQKFESPYKWWLVGTPPVRLHSCAPASVNILDGLCLSAGEEERIGRLLNDIEDHSCPNDAIYVYPNMPVLYLASRRSPFAGAVVSWFDFMSDESAYAVVRGLRAAPPPVVVMDNIDEMVLKSHENLFRNGKPLVQREIVRTIGDLERRGRLNRIDRVTIDDTTIDVLAAPAHSLQTCTNT